MFRKVTVFFKLAIFSTCLSVVGTLPVHDKFEYRFLYRKSYPAVNKVIFCNPIVICSLELSLNNENRNIIVVHEFVIYLDSLPRRRLKRLT